MFPYIEVSVVYLSINTRCMLDIHLSILLILNPFITFTTSSFTFLFLCQSPWWPAMVLAASDGKVIPPTPSPHAVGSANISRIPSIICKQLVKLKGKFYSNESKLSNISQNHSQTPLMASCLPHPSAAANSLSLIPEGYALVEFFGTHDFGWVRQDTMIPIIFDGTDSISPPGLSGKIGEWMCVRKIQRLCLSVFLFFLCDAYDIFRSVLNIFLILFFIILIWLLLHDIYRKPKLKIFPNLLFRAANIIISFL